MKNNDKHRCPARAASFGAQSGGLPAERFPQTEEEASIADALLAEAFGKLSVKDRENVLHDIHGVADVPDENVVIVQQKLLDLDSELGVLCHDQEQEDNQEAYALALELNKAYVTSTIFRRMFLRRENYDVQKAAAMILQHFEVKRKWFGEGEVLARPVYQSDLTEQARKLLDMGLMRLWPDRDTSGRAVMSLEGKHVVDVTDHIGEEHCRVLWYMMMKALEHEETQIRGAVWVIPFPQIDRWNFDVDQSNDFGDIKLVIPLKIVSQHFCYQHSAQRPLITGLRMFANEYERPRMQCHHGSEEEIVSKLQTFGIPTRHLVWTKESASHQISLHREWLVVQRELESRNDPLVQHAPTTTNSVEDSDTSVFLVPRRFDVLFGRSAFARGHTGTLRAMHIVEMKFDAYERVGRYEKMEMAEKIVKEIRESGGRFLRQGDACQWMEVHDDDARKKLAHWFRRRRQERQLSRVKKVDG